jgi:hypothetical protein
MHRTPDEDFAMSQALLPTPSRPAQLRRTEQLTIAEMMVLMCGAAIGMAVYQSARIHDEDALAFGWRQLVFVCYLALAGMAMVASVLMLVERFRRPRPWAPPAVALFVVGLLAWCLAPFVTCTFIVLDACRPDHLWFENAYLAYEPGGLSLVGFSEVWPVVSLVLLGACAASGQATRWWQCRGSWPEWMGMWMLTAWSLPIVGLWYRAATAAPLLPEIP